MEEQKSIYLAWNLFITHGGSKEADKKYSHSLESLQPIVGLSQRVYMKVPQSPDPAAE